MEKESLEGEPCLAPGAFLWMARTDNGGRSPRRKQGKKADEKKVVAYRRACKRPADGTGLSHYIMMDAKKK